MTTEEFKQSRIGKAPIALPQGVDVTVSGNTVTVKGPKGTLKHDFKDCVEVYYKDCHVGITLKQLDTEGRALSGLYRSILHNMVVGVSEGFKKELEINGVGYRAEKKGNELVMNLGYSHQVRVAETDGIKIDVPSANSIIVSGADKQKVGQMAAEIRMKRPPEPYKGKGIKYVDTLLYLVIFVSNLLTIISIL